MKAYILNIKLNGSKPLIWRRVIMPAGATYKRLHDVIQSVTNFQGGYPSDGYHLYEFKLNKENRSVTNNEEAYLDHKYYKENKALFEERLLSTPADMLAFEKAYQEQLHVEVRKPTGLKINDYLEKYKQITYNYDLGDGWRFTVILEDIVDDYYFGFPTLLDGAETAPPEDVGGLRGYYTFLKVYKDNDHPEHDEVRRWAESIRFREYDSQRTNEVLKSIKYKKTEWNKIDHETYTVLEDKYRGN